MAELPDFSAVPVYQTFFEQPELYERYHIHLIGLTGGTGGGIQNSLNRLGFTKLRDAVADPYVTVETFGEDTGSTDYFGIGVHKFPVLNNSPTPLWDAKCTLIAKKGSTEGIFFRILDEDGKTDEVLLELTLPREDLPEAASIEDAEWRKFVRTSTSGRTEGMDFVFQVMVSDGASRVVSKEETEAFCQDSERLTYTEEVVPDDSEDPEDNALLQCWRQKAEGASNKAVFWVIGRNDCFMHPHVAGKLFGDFDLYVLNYKMNGCCRKQGWVTNPYFNSHNKSGNFDVYNSDIVKSLEIVNASRKYETVLGYAHSTGAPILANYLMEYGDAAFDGFIFNSPFLDWGFVGGDMVEFVLKQMSLLRKLSFGHLPNDTMMGLVVTPDALKDTPIRYLDHDVVPSDWSARIWSLYYFDWGSRPLYSVPMTAGFAEAVTAVHSKMEKLHSKKQVVTLKPLLVITSRGDDVLKSPETLSRADWLGSNRCEVELDNNGHDVFLSQDKDDVGMALDMVAAWMKNQKFL